MKNLSTVLLILFSLTSFGQELKTTKVKEKTRNGRAVYQVLKSDPTVYHGRYYIEAWSGNSILLDGAYVLGKRHGSWKEKYYHLGNRGNKLIGQYDNDVKTGIWVYFNLRGDTAQVYDYSTNRLIFTNECNSQKNYLVTIDNQTKRAKLDCPPLFKGGNDIFTTNLIQVNSSYPQQLKALGQHTFEIKTSIHITIDLNGLVHHVKLSKEIGYGFDEKIINWITQEANEWIPGKLNGQPVQAEVEFPLYQKYQF